MKFVTLVLGAFLVALPNITGYCQEQSPAKIQVGTVNIARIQSQSLLKAKFDNDLHKMADQLDATYKQQIQAATMTKSEQKLLAEQFQAQLSKTSSDDNLAFTRAVQEAIAKVAEKRGFELILTDDVANFNDKTQANVTVYNTTPLSVITLAHTGVDVTNDVIEQLNQQSVTAASSSGANALPLPVTSSNVVFHEDTLNRAFRLTTEELNQAIDKGKQLAQQGKKWDDVYKPVAQMPRGVKGEKGRSHESTVYCTTLNAIDLTAAAYKAANNYDPLPPHFTHDGYAKQVHFFVSLISVPKVGATVFDRNRSAGVDDVQVNKFVLTDDKGNVINPVDTASTNGVQSGMMDFFGVNSVNHVNTSQTNTNVNAYTYDSDGNSANGYGSGTQTTTRTWTEYIPWSVSHPFYSATYNVAFPLFDENGQALIKTDAKSIILHIITPNGEKQVVYDLHPPKI